MRCGVEGPGRGAGDRGNIIKTHENLKVEGGGGSELREKSGGTGGMDPGEIRFQHENNKRQTFNRLPKTKKGSVVTLNTKGPGRETGLKGTSGHDKEGLHHILQGRSNMVRTTSKELDRKGGGNQKKKWKKTSTLKTLTAGNSLSSCQELCRGGGGQRHEVDESTLIRGF